MAKFKIDETEYDTDQLSDDAKNQLMSMQFCDMELERVKAEAVTLQTARNAYFNALKVALSNPEPKTEAEKEDAAPKKKKGVLGMFSK